jgi:hypothetical protein
MLNARRRQLYRAQRKRPTNHDAAPEPGPFTLVYKCSKNTPKTAIPATLQPVLHGLQLQGWLGNTLQHHEIGDDPCSAEPSQNRVGIGAPKLPHRIPLIVHYLRLFTFANDLHELA